MGLYNISCPASSLFMLAILQVIGYMNKRELLVDDVFADFFIDPDTEDGWSKIQAIIEPHGNSKLLPTAAIPSKPPRQGDASFNPFMVQRAHYNLAIMYKTAVRMGNIKDPDDEYLRVDLNPADHPTQNLEATQRWNAIISAYEVCREMESQVYLIFEAIKPLYHSISTWSKSPMEIYFYCGEYMHGIFVAPDGLHPIPWETIDQFKTEDPNKLGIIDVMFNHQVSKLWFIPIPIITFGGGGKSFPGCSPATGYVMADHSDTFKKGGTFVPDPPTPPPPPPDPPYTPPTGGASGDLFKGPLFHVSIVAGTDPVDTGTIIVSYTRIIVTYP